MDCFSHSALRITANLVVSSGAYLLSIHSCLLDGVSQVLGTKLASGVLEAIAIGLRKQREKNYDKVQVCLTSKATGMQN